MTKRKNSKEVRFRKINLEFLINTLTHIYEAGADYVDIIGTQDDVQDTINIVVQEEYLANQEDELLEEELREDSVPSKLSDEDINNLIDE